MTPYLALMFCKQEDLRSFGKEVLAAVQSVAGTRFKYGEGAASVVALAFVTDKEWPVIAQAFHDLWRMEQRCWVLPLAQERTLIDKALVDWAKKAAQHL